MPLPEELPEPLCHWCSEYWPRACTCPDGIALAIVDFVREVASVGPLVPLVLEIEAIKAIRNVDLAWKLMRARKWFDLSLMTEDDIAANLARTEEPATPPRPTCVWCGLPVMWMLDQGRYLHEGAADHDAVSNVTEEATR